LQRADGTKMVDSACFTIDGILIAPPDVNTTWQLGSEQVITINSYISTEANHWDLFLLNENGNQIGQIADGLNLSGETKSFDYNWMVGRLFDGSDATPGVYRIECSGWENDDDYKVYYSEFFSITEQTMLPDVVITNIWLEPAAPAPGQKVTVKATIKNQGTAATPGGVVVAATFKVDGGALGAFFVRINGLDRPLAAGESYSAACETQWKAAAGTHTVWVMADDANRFPEANENNNVMDKSYTIANLLSDVVITNLSRDLAAPIPGQKVTFKATIQNQGTVTTPVGIEVAVAFKIDETYLGAFFVMNGSSFKSLAAGESYPGICNVQWTATAGTHTVLAMADDINRFPESNEGNNVKEKSFTVVNALPDVVITNIWLEPAAPMSGQKVTVKATIKNQGTAATPSGIVVAAAFRVDEWALGAFFIRTNGLDRPLAVGESYSAACETQWTTTAGTHTIWVMADDVNRFPESNDNNNVRTITVGPL
jgi:hypothetical protein